MNPNDPDEEHSVDPYDDKKSGRSRSHNRSRSIALESGSEKSNSDHALMHRGANPSQKKVGAAGGSSFSSSVSAQSTKGSGSYQFEGNNRHHRTASVPKFGEWDEADPKSGEGYTAIFNKVKEEKQAPSSTHFPNVPPPPQHSNQHEQPSFWSKIFCCLFPHGSD
ncbi:hypothetical protein PTKIN_Ptkin04bG0239400 [Pterospermum kingtungense]